MISWDGLDQPMSKAMHTDQVSAVSIQYNGHASKKSQISPDMIIQVGYDEHDGLAASVDMIRPDHPQSYLCKFCVRGIRGHAGCLGNGFHSLVGPERLSMC